MAAVEIAAAAPTETGEAATVAPPKKAALRHRRCDDCRFRSRTTSSPLGGGGGGGESVSVDGGDGERHLSMRLFRGDACGIEIRKSTVIEKTDSAVVLPYV